MLIDSWHCIFLALRPSFTSAAILLSFLNCLTLGSILLKFLPSASIQIFAHSYLTTCSGPCYFQAFHSLFPHFLEQLLWIDDELLPLQSSGFWGGWRSQCRNFIWQQPEGQAGRWFGRWCALLITYEGASSAHNTWTLEFAIPPQVYLFNCEQTQARNYPNWLECWISRKLQHNFESFP